MKKLIKALFVAVFLLLILSEGVIQYFARDPMRDSEFDQILVLCLSGEKDNPIVIDRAKVGAEAWRRWPNAKIIVTGNGRRHQVEAIKSWLLMEGVPESTIAEETESTDTWENIAFSKKLFPPESRVLVVTTEFHQPRALAFARIQGLRASTFGKDPRKYATGLHYAIREIFANVKGMFLILKFEIGG